MSEDEIERWAGMYHSFLMVERGATVGDVFLVAEEWLGQSRFFPTIADLAPQLEALVSRRLDAEQVETAQASAVPVPALDGEIDWSKVPTRELPPGYDFSQDADWQRGIAKLQAMHEDASPATGLGGFVAQIDLNRRTFQGAARERRQDCPRCDGARWLRGTGYDAPKQEMGRPGSSYVKCPTCCPGGQYDEVAERAAIRRAALWEASVQA